MENHCVAYPPIVLTRYVLLRGSRPILQALCNHINFLFSYLWLKKWCPVHVRFCLYLGFNAYKYDEVSHSHASTPTRVNFNKSVAAWKLYFNYKNAYVVHQIYTLSTTVIVHTYVARCMHVNINLPNIIELLATIVVAVALPLAQ